jgi:triacylglycerol lipase
MELSKEVIDFIVRKYKEIRYQDRKIFFKNKDKPEVQVDGLVNSFEIKHLQVAVLKKDKYNIIMILGSNQIKDWFYNLSFHKRVVPYKEAGTNKKVRVHNGFYKSYLKIRSKIMEIVKDMDNVIFMGQSFGAAISSLAALDIEYNLQKQCINFITGGPRIGNKHFVKSYNKRVPNTFRYVNGNDLFTGIPFKLFGYKHISKEIHLGKKRRLGLSIKDHLYKKGAYIDSLKQ